MLMAGLANIAEHCTAELYSVFGVAPFYSKSFRRTKVVSGARFMNFVNLYNLSATTDASRKLKNQLCIDKDLPDVSAGVLQNSANSRTADLIRLQP